MTLTKQKVYLPVKVEDELPKESGFYKTEEEGTSFFQRGDQTWWDNDVDGTKRFPENWLKKEEGYFFTPEQLNEYTQKVIKQALETAAENADYRHNGRMYQNAEGVYYHREGIKVNKKSITNTFEETYNKHKL